jgi:hypothetical protein
LFDVYRNRCLWAFNDLSWHSAEKQNPPEHLVYSGGSLFRGVQYIFARCYFYHFATRFYFGGGCGFGEKTTKKEKTIKKRAILQAIDLLLKKQ